MASSKPDIENLTKTGRLSHKTDTVVKVGDTMIGGGGLTLIAGPCSVESEEQIVTIAKEVKKYGATMLRGGAFKARTSPYSFQGLGKEGLRFLEVAKKETGLSTVSEITDVSEIENFESVDVLQVGARNMQNFTLLKELGRLKKPVLLKRGMSATYEELLFSAEYIMAEGNENVILCERGIRSFEPYTRNVLDVAAVPSLKKFTHLPIIVDPSHGTGRHDLVEPMALASIAAGADGIIVEVHNDPDNALSDGSQSQMIDRFANMSKKLYALHDFLKTIE